jgi:hypothetical protein
MRKSIATVSLSGSLAEKLAAAAAAAGFDGVEIFENDLLASPLSPEEVRLRAADLGLAIEIYQPFRDFEAVPADVRLAVLPQRPGPPAGREPRTPPTARSASPSTWLPAPANTTFPGSTSPWPPATSSPPHAGCVTSGPRCCRFRATTTTTDGGHVRVCGTADGTGIRQRPLPGERRPAALAGSGGAGR